MLILVKTVNNLKKSNKNKQKKLTKNVQKSTKK